MVTDVGLAVRWNEGVVDVVQALEVRDAGVNLDDNLLSRLQDFRGRSNGST